MIWMGRAALVSESSKLLILMSRTLRDRTSVSVSLDGSMSCVSNDHGDYLRQGDDYDEIVNYQSTSIRILQILRFQTIHKYLRIGAY